MLRKSPNIAYLALPYLTLPYLTLPYLTLPYRTLPYRTLPYLTLPYLTLPYLTLPYLTLPYLTLPYLTLPYLTLPYLTVPYLTLPYLSCSGLVAHKAAALLLQFVLSLATCFASVHVFHASSCLSFSTDVRQVVFGRPTLLFPSDVYVKAARQWLSSFFLRTYIFHPHLLIFTSIVILFILFSLFRICLFDTTQSHLTLRILLRHFNWNVSSFRL